MVLRTKCTGDYTSPTIQSSDDISIALAFQGVNTNGRERKARDE